MTPKDLFEQAFSLQQKGRWAEAEPLYRQLLAEAPSHFPTLRLLGFLYLEDGRPAEALPHLDAALKLQPDDIATRLYRSHVFLALKRLDDAIADCDRILARQPGLPDALFSRGLCLQRMARLEEALACYDQALVAMPEHLLLHINRGLVLQHLRRYAEAAACYEGIRKLEPSAGFAVSGLADCAMTVCDWPRMAAIRPELEAQTAKGDMLIVPGMLIAYGANAALQRRCGENFTRLTVPANNAPLWRGTRFRNSRIRIVYLSGDFHDHATARLMAELIERHDRSHFEICAFSYGPDDGSAMRARLAKGFEDFLDVSGHSDETIAEMLRKSGVEIAVDLKGHTKDARTGILAHRPVPIQVQYLGFPGSMGSDFIDYVIGDAIVTPQHDARFFSEKIVTLPDCYQPNDTTRGQGGETPSRAQAGLPEQGFVFCCFNNNWKITPPVFDVWMRLLADVRGSVLWLLADNDDAVANLRREAQVRGVDPARLVFAPRVPLLEHLARHRLADLFLDTLPCNAHTTGSEALWMGLPLVTCKGETFAGRVGASLLMAAGLPELVTNNLQEYETLALALARDSVRLGGLRDRLVQGRNRCALFDTERLARHLETAYQQMWEIWQQGEAPRAFAVD